MTKHRTTVFGLLLATACAAAAPAPRPIGDALKQLADADPAVRESARITLMGLPASDIPALRDAAAARPLRPAQIVALREIVSYVLTRDAMSRLPTRGEPFLGIGWPPRMIMNDGGFDLGAIGVSVAYRVPGFAAARFLEDGDVILGFVYEGRDVPVNGREELIGVIRGFRAGENLPTYVQRGGRVIKIDIPLDARPRPVAESEDRGTELPLTNLVEAAVQEAEKAYEKDFGPLGDAEAD